MSEQKREIPMTDDPKDAAGSAPLETLGDAIVVRSLRTGAVACRGGQRHDVARVLDALADQWPPKADAASPALPTWHGYSPRKLRGSVRPDRDFWVRDAETHELRRMTDAEWEAEMKDDAETNTLSEVQRPPLSNESAMHERQVPGRPMEIVALPTLLEKLIHDWKTWESTCSVCRARSSRCEVCRVAVAQMHVAAEQLEAALASSGVGIGPSEELERLAAFCEQTARDGVLPSLAWFSETAATLRGVGIGSPRPAEPEK